MVLCCDYIMEPRIGVIRSLRNLATDLKRTTIGVVNTFDLEVSGRAVYNFFCAAQTNF